MSTAGDLEGRASEAFAEQYGSRPTALGVAPGRVELLGNHTDYNGGLVMAVAIDRFTAVAGRSIPGRSCRAYALNFKRADTFNLDALERDASGDWPNYVKGVAWAIAEARGARLSSGFDLAMVGNVPLGAGLSSSASLQAALAFFLLQAGVVPGQAAGDYEGQAADPAAWRLPRFSGDRRTRSSASPRDCSTSFRASSARPIMRFTLIARHSSTHVCRWVSLDRQSSSAIR